MKNNRMTKTATVIMSLVVSLALISCEKTSTDPEADLFDIQGENGFVGTVEGTNAFVSILVGTDEGIAYVCNGDEDISEWFRGPVSDPMEISFTNIEGAKITASFIGNSFQGEVSLRDGRKFLFDADANTETYGGIYRVLGEDAVQAEIEAGWIVKSEADQRGSFKFKKVTQPTVSLSKSNLENIKDGTSNTLVMSEVTVSFFRFRVSFSGLKEDDKHQDINFF